MGNQLQQLSEDELLMTLTLGNWALTSIYETKETEVGKCYGHFAHGTKPGRQQTIPRHYALLRITYLLHVISVLFVHGHTSPWPCNIFLLQRGTVNTPGTEFNNFSNHILFILFKGGDKNSAQSKWQQYWSHRKNSSKCDLQRMFSGPWESKEGIQALLFQDTLSLCLTCL